MWWPRAFCPLVARAEVRHGCAVSVPERKMARRAARGMTKSGSRWVERPAGVVAGGLAGPGNLAGRLPCLSGLPVVPVMSVMPVMPVMLVMPSMSHLSAMPGRAALQARPALRYGATVRPWDLASIPQECPLRNGAQRFGGQPALFACHAAPASARHCLSHGEVSELV